MGAITALVGGLLTAAVTVSGNTTCPTPATVEARLRPMLTASHLQDRETNQEVRLRRRGDVLDVTLLQSDGRPVAERSIGGSHDCEALAEAAAVIVATWRGGVARRTFLANPPVPDNEVRGQAPEPSIAAAAGSWGLGLAVGVSLAGSHPAPAAGLTLAHLPWPQHPWRKNLAARVAVVYQGERQAFLAGGGSSWQRWAVELGPEVLGDLDFLPLAWGVHLGAAAALTRLEGRDLLDPRRHNDLGLGVCGGGRLTFRRSGVRPFLALDVRGWPTRIVAYEGAAQREATVPRVEVMVAVGLALGTP